MKKLLILILILILSSCSLTKKRKKISSTPKKTDLYYLEKRTEQLHLNQTINLLIMIDYELFNFYPQSKIVSNLKNFLDHMTNIFDARIALSPLNSKKQFVLLAKNDQLKNKRITELENVNHSVFFDHLKPEVDIINSSYIKLTHLVKDDFFRKESKTALILLTTKDDHHYEKDMYHIKYQDLFYMDLNKILELNKPFLNAALQEERFYQFKEFRLFSIIPFTKCRPFYRFSPKLKLASQTVYRQYVSKLGENTDAMNLCEMTLDQIFENIFQILSKD
jgi:hypothetical protein